MTQTGSTGTDSQIPATHAPIPVAAYHAHEAVSNSDLKALSVSPLNLWNLKFNPDLPCGAIVYDAGRNKKRPCGIARKDHPTTLCHYFQNRAETPSMRVGTALHAAVLEPDTFLSRYSCDVTREDFLASGECLDTIEELKAWLRPRGGALTGNKPVLIAEVQRLAGVSRESVSILDVEVAAHAVASDGKTILKKTEWEQVSGMAKALLREEALRELLLPGGGEREVSLFAQDPATGVLMKCRIDWCTTRSEDDTSLDLKSFADRDSSVDRMVNKAIQNYHYVQQAVYYTNIRRLAGHGETSWCNAFVSSESPYEVRLRRISPEHEYWPRTEEKISKLLRMYAHYRDTFGTRPWAYHQEFVDVTDADIKVFTDVGEEF